MNDPRWNELRKKQPIGRGKGTNSTEQSPLVWAGTGALVPPVPEHRWVEPPSPTRAASPTASS